MKTIALLLALLLATTLSAQVSISTDSSSPDNSAMLDVKSNSKGFLLPRMTNAERDAITDPAPGLIIYNSEQRVLQIFDGNTWMYLFPSGCTPAAPPFIYGNPYPECNAADVIYNIDLVPFASSYTWSVPADAMITSGQGTSNIMVDFGIESGVVSVKANSGCGNSDLTNLPISIGIPASLSIINGNSSPECNEVGAIYTCYEAPGATYYRWTISPNATITAGQGTPTILVDFGTECGEISVRAENSCGNSDYTSLPVVPFECGTPIIDARDSRIYNTVQVGTQCWMAENLNIGTQINTSISQEQQFPEIIEKYCYNDNEDSCEIYGGLYRWNEMMQYSSVEGSQGICPAGWHIPSNAEWCSLENYVDTDTIDCALEEGYAGTDAGGNLKESGMAHWNSPNTGATNSSGFTALPAGWVQESGVSSGGRLTAAIWSSSSSWIGAAARMLSSNNSMVYINFYFFPTNGFSVRCLRD
jgi:uncharacterized protein (TIGR02145 family)